MKQAQEQAHRVVPGARRSPGRLRAGLGSVLTALAVASTLSGCGSDSAVVAVSPTEYSEAVASAWNRAEGTKVSEAQARCWGEKLVDRLGIDRISAYGAPVDFGAGTVNLDLTSMNLSQDEAQAVYDDFASCGGNLTRDKNLLVDELGLPEDMQICISDSLDADVMEDYFVSALQNGKDTAAAGVSDEGLEPVLERCVEQMSEQLLDVLDAG